MPEPTPSGEVSGTGTRWFISRRTAWRAGWGAVGVVVFGWAAVSAVLAFARAPRVDSAALVFITVPLLVMALVLAGEALGQGMLRLDATGYSTPLGRRRAWTDVLAVATGVVEGRQVPVVAVRADDDGFPIIQDVFSGFLEAEASWVVAALRARTGPAGFGGLEVGPQWWTAVEAEADRVVAVVAANTGRQPLMRERVPFGFAEVITAIRLDYGTNDAGEQVELFVRRGTDLAVTAHGRRWLRQHRKRSGDPAAQVGWLFEPHTSQVIAAEGVGFDRLVLTWEGRRPLTFNAEEPDRF